MARLKDRRAFQKKFQRAREEHEFARRRIKGPQNRIFQRTPRNRARSLDLRPPTVFSLILNPDLTIQFLNLLEENGKKQRVRIRFDDVGQITPDAAMALVGTMAKVPNGRISGNTPNSPTCKAILEESGFFDHVLHKFDITASVSGRIKRRTSNQVEGPFADELITVGTTAMYGETRTSPASYRVLVEAMQNTRDHAHFNASLMLGDERLLEKETWWAMVYADTMRKKICFAFLDVGVGIFKSARLKGWRKINRALRLLPDSDILRQILEGKLESRTGLDHRGKGLPSMNQLNISGEIEKLTIVTNAVFGNVSENEYRDLRSAFRGTLIYWEI